MNQLPIQPGYGHPHWGRFWGGLVAFLILDTLMLIPLLAGVAPAWIATGYSVVMVVMIGWIMVTAMRWLWNPVMAPYPPVEPAAYAERRSCQSFSVGLLNLSLSIHAAVDDNFLHLTPASLLRIFGARGASIPWNACEPSKKAVLGTHSVTINGNIINGPAWCLEPFAGRDKES